MKKIYRVSELIEEINWLLEDAYGLISVEGEASEVRVSQKGHIYFNLKDEKAVIKVVVWSYIAYKLPFKIEEGRVFIVSGSLKIYPAYGEFELEARNIEPYGIGALKLALEQRKKKLEAEGLFDPEKKKPFPFLPQRIGVITSPDGAAIIDFLKILKEVKIPLNVIIFPSLMQGKNAIDEIIEGLHYFKKEKIELIVITRGGGSFEELMVFNEEVLVREIFNSSIPVLSAVGHEVDVTLCDLVADIRAATPTDAARIIKGHLDKIFDNLMDYEEKIYKFLFNKLEKAELKLKLYSNYFTIKAIKEKIGRYYLKLSKEELKLKEISKRFLFKKKEKLKDLSISITKNLYNFCNFYKNKVNEMEIKIKNIKYFLEKKKELLKSLENSLRQLDVKRTLKRGFSIIWKDGKALREANETEINEELKAQLYKGGFLCKVIKKENN